MITLSLPYPPSANRLWRNVPGKGTLKAKAYRDWLNAASGWLRSARPEVVNGAYRLTIIAIRPDNRARDIDNLVKPVSDLLALCGVVSNDSLAQSVFIGWSLESPVKDGLILVSVEPFLDPIMALGKAA